MLVNGVTKGFVRTNNSSRYDWVKVSAGSDMSGDQLSFTTKDGSVSIRVKLSEIYSLIQKAKITNK